MGVESTNPTPTEAHPAQNDARCPRHPRAAIVYTDPTGGDPFMGGPVTIAVCAECGYQVADARVTPPVATPAEPDAGDVEALAFVVCPDLTHTMSEGHDRCDEMTERLTEWLAAHDAEVWGRGFGQGARTAEREAAEVRRATAEPDAGDVAALREWLRQHRPDRPGGTGLSMQAWSDLIDLLAGVRRATAEQTLRDAADEWHGFGQGRGVMFNRDGLDLTPQQRVEKWLRDRAARLAREVGAR
jgi:hypothetical protein